MLKIDATDKLIGYKNGGNEELAYKSDMTAFQDHIDETSGAHAASAISNAPTGNLSATTVQGALDELQGDIDAIDLTDLIDDSAMSLTTVYSSQKSDQEFVNAAGDSMTGTLAMGSNRITGLADPVNAQDAATKNYVDTNFIPTSEKGAALGVAELDGSGKVPVSQLPSAIMTYEGVWDASTNTPSLADGTGDAGMVYRVSVAGSQDLGSGGISFEVGDYVIYNGTIWEKSDTTDAVASVNGFTGVVSLDSDDISEGSVNLYYTEARFDSSFSGKDTDDLSEGVANLYFTEARAKAAAVSDVAYAGSWNGVTDVAASKNAVYDQIELERARILALENVSPEIFKKVLISGDITNEYIDLAHLAIETNDFHVFVDRLALHQGAAEDYTLSVEGGVTRITFLNEMVGVGNQKLAVGDNIYVRYKRSL